MLMRMLQAQEGDDIPRAGDSIALTDTDGEEYGGFVLETQEQSYGVDLTI